MSHLLSQKGKWIDFINFYFNLNMSPCFFYEDVALRLNHMKKSTKIHDLTWPGSNLRPIACEANDVPLRQGPQRPKILDVYVTHILGGSWYRGKQFVQPRTTGEKFESHMSFSAVPINTDKEIENKFLVFGPVKML